MKPHANESMPAMILTTAVTLTLFCATAIAAIAGWVPEAFGHTGTSVGTAPAKLVWLRVDMPKPDRFVTPHAGFVAPDAPANRSNAIPKITKG
jgi:hypothetical protein